MAIEEVQSNEFSFHLLKKKIARILANQHKGNEKMLQEKINDLRCKCIFAMSCWSLQPNTGTEQKVLIEDQVSNVCLMLLNFLMLDGQERIDGNLNTLYEKSMKNTEQRQSGTDEVMMAIISPIYVQFFANRYRQLKNESNYSDPFIYDQRFNAWALGGMFFDDNELVCGEGTFCYETLTKFANTWNNISIVMDFPWDMGFGTIVANFNFLLDICDDGSMPFQEAEQQWSGFNNNTLGRCRFEQNMSVFYKDMAVLSSIISGTTFEGLYLNDLFGFLGYSPTFDVSSLQEDGYVSTTKSLHPMYGIDRWLGNSEYDSMSCVYKSTYQRWTRNIEASIQNPNIGTDCTHTLIIYK